VQIVAFVGSILFIISDVVLAYSRFYFQPTFGYHIWARSAIVLGTYWGGQTLLTLGLFLKPAATRSKSGKKD